MHIVIRTCMLGNNLKNRAFKFQNKETMIFECLNSLFKSCQKVKDRIKITIVDDSGNYSFRENLKELLKSSNLNGEVIGINVQSNSKSIIFCLDLFKKSKEDLFFLCEDDYLFTEDAIPFILNAYDKKVIGVNEFCVFPCDYPYPYEKLYPSYIFIDDNTHWRSIMQTTGTFVITRKIFNDNLDILYDFGNTAVDFKLIKLWEKVPMISPIPSLATHLNYDTMSPLVNWESFIQNKTDTNKHPKEKINKDNLLKKVKRIIKWYYKNVLNKPFLIQNENNHLNAFEQFKEAK
jgi:hypothetical protein